MEETRRERLVGVCGGLAARVREAEPGGWSRAVLKVYATGLRGAGFVVYTAPEGRRRERMAGIDAEIAELVRLAKGPTAGLDVVLAVEDAGAYEAVVTERSARGLMGGTCTLERDLPEPPRPRERPERDEQAGDPAEAVRLMDAYLGARAEILGQPAPARTPVPAEALARAEERIGAALPDDLRALYEAGHHPEGFYWRWLEAAELAQEYAWALQADLRGGGVALDADPPGTVRRVRNHERWIPFAHDEDGNHLAVDLAPARHGRPGQVIACGGDYADGPGYVADSVTSLLRTQLAWLRDGAYDVEDPPGWDRDGEKYLAFRTDRWHGEAQRVRSHLVDAPGVPLVPDPRLQHLTVRGVDGAVDLAPLAAAPLLKHLNLRCGSADLTPLAALPVEELEVAADTDLGPLAGHPALRVLTVATDRPVRLADLRAIPNLVHLDVSAAPVVDLEVLPELPSLRSLCLRRGQWEELWRRTDRHPRLAYASVAGEEDSAARALWAEQLPSAPAEPLLRLTGVLPG